LSMSSREKGLKVCSLLSAISRVLWAGVAICQFHYYRFGITVSQKAKFRR
jgi:hypothetical protein